MRSLLPVSGSEPLSKNPMFNFQPLLLDDKRRLLLKAAIGSGPTAAESFRAWRAAVPLNDITHAATRTMPLLVDLVIREGLNDPDFLRMKGIERHIWASNTLRYRSLFKALDIIRISDARFVLMKAGALIARMPKSAGLRVSGDYDVMIEPSRLAEIGRNFKAAGFTSMVFDLEDFDETFQNITMSGAGIMLAGTSDEIDVHWRPLARIRDPELTDKIFRQSEQMKLHDRVVFVPSLTHHLFTCLARCAPWDKDECLTRLIEAHLLLSAPGTSIDWDELKELVGHYGLDAWAAAFFQELSSATDLPMPPAIQWQQPSWPILKRLEWSAVGTKPDDRSSWQRNVVLHQERKSFRRSPSEWALTPRETWLQAQSRFHPKSITSLWQSLSQRVHGRSSGRIRFLYGFSYPEASARWTDGRLAFMAVPLTDKQKAGEPVRIHAHALGKKGGSRIVATGGLARTLTKAKNGMEPIVLSVPLQPLEALGGDGLLLLWMPDARSPKSMGLNEDARVLSLYIHRAQPDVKQSQAVSS